MVMMTIMVMVMMMMMTKMMTMRIRRNLHLHGPVDEGGGGGGRKSELLFFTVNKLLSLRRKKHLSMNQEDKKLMIFQMAISVTKVETSNGPLIDIFYTVYQLRRQRCVV